MSVYRRTSLGVVGAVLIAVILGFVAATSFPSEAPALISTTTSISSIAVTSTASTTYVVTTTATVALNVSSSTLPPASITTVSSVASTENASESTTAVTTSTVSAPMLGIASANLTVNANGTFLSAVITNAGTHGSANCTISLSSVTLAVILELAAQGRTWIEIQVPSGLTVEIGQTYEIIVAIEGLPSTQVSLEVTAMAA